MVLPQAADMIRHLGRERRCGCSLGMTGPRITTMWEVMDEAGRINANGGPYAGLDRFEARARILADLEARGLLVGVKEHVLPLRRCDRCETIVA